METPEPVQGVDADERYRRTVAHAVLRGVVHDLNNPLATVMMAAAALRSPADEQQHAELVDIIEREAMRAGALANDATGRYATPLGTAPVPIGRLATQLRARCRDAGLDVEVHLDADPDTALDIDPELLPGALVTFAADAHKAEGRQGPVQVRLAVDDEELAVTVSDDGVPVPETLAQRPFQPLPQQQSAGRGIGLGVAAARSHVRLHGGRVHLGPGADTGTVVTVRLPTGAGDDVAAVSSPADAATGRALVVDDDEPMRKLLTLVLRRAGWEVMTAATGAEADAALAGHAVDIVLLDVHLGAEYGPDIAAELARRRPGTGDVVVYLTGDMPPSGVIQGRPAIAKPFTLEDLYRVVGDVGASSRPL